MPGYQPLSTYPFAMNSALFMGGIFFTFKGQRLNFSTTVLITNANQAIVMLLLPFAARLGGA